MSAQLEALLGRLRCPACGAFPLREDGGALVCACGGRLAIVSRDPLAIGTTGEEGSLEQFVPPQPSRAGLRGRVRLWASRSDGRFATRMPVLPDSRIPELRAALESRPAGRRAVIDVGGGKGRWRSLLGEPADFTSVDVIDPARLPVSPGVTYVQSRSETLPFRDGSFDVALSMQVIEHIAEPARNLAETARVLADGGLLLLATAQAWRTHGAPHDYFRFTRYGLDRLLDAAGFDVEARHPLGGPASVVMITVENNVPVLSRPLVRQAVVHPLWRLAALLDRTAFAEARDGASPETSGWVVAARRRPR